MADNFGNEQNRVLNVIDRNLDNVIFQYKHPPLTSEWNLINQISNEKIQSLARVALPSGWLHTNEILQDAVESDTCTGCVLCSESYSANSFKLVSLNNNIAIVNGWPILVQGSNSTDNNNIITLDNPTGQFYDFVFLEVWRKLVGTNDYIYPYGNVTKNPYFDNEIEWNVVGCETTKRIQIQYRIRNIAISSSITDATKEIFDLVAVHPIGGRNTQAYHQTFGRFGSSDPGLYVAGDGSESSKTYLNTVDGYVYAVPMFIVYRRTLSDNEFNATLISNTIVNKEMMLDGYRSDRPDNKIADIIYKDDIVDLRHRVIVSNDLKNIADETISKLLAGDLTTGLKKGFGTDGAITNFSSGGNTLMKVERTNSISGIPNIGTGSDISDSAFKRRAFCNAEITHDHNIVGMIYNGTSSWEAGSFTIASRVTFPDGEIVSIDGYYSSTGLVTGVTDDGVSIYIADDSSLIGTSDVLFMEFTFKYYSSHYGFKDVPREFIEVTKNDTISIATRDNTVLIKRNVLGELLNFGASSGKPGFPGNPGDPDYVSANDFIRYRGGNYTEMSNFGHELVLYRTAINGIVTIGMYNYKFNGKYDIMGVKSVEASGYQEFTVNRSSSACIITIGALISNPEADVVITLYTGSISDSFKFFEMSKQGRGIIDTYEMIEVTAEKEGNRYVIDTGNKPIIKIASRITSSGEGIPFVFNSLGEMIDIDAEINRQLPILNDSGYDENNLPTMLKIEILSEIDPIKVPVLVHSYVEYSESPYNVYYKTVPYQGLLNSTTSVYGKVIEECSAVITSSGSGSIVNHFYNLGTASFTSGIRTVTGVATEWLAFAAAGDFIRLESSSRFYRIKSIESDTSLTLAETYVEESTEDPASYEIVKLDVPDSVISNVVDRLPALSIISSENITDYTCYSDLLTLGSDYGDIIMVSPRRKLQDPLNALTNDFMLGSSGSAKRGRNDFRLTAGGNSVYKIGNGRPYLIYDEVSCLSENRNKKVYQFYLFVRSGKGYSDYLMSEYEPDLTGKVYLMVIAGETIDCEKNLLNPYFNKDVVDIFELVGRPIIRG